MKKEVGTVIVVGVIVFAVTVAAQLYILQPDPTPQTLKGKAWLPGPPQSSELLSQRNNARKNGQVKGIDLDSFKATEFRQSDVVVAFNQNVSYLDYYGQLPDGTFVSSSGYAPLLPVRSAIYTSDWQTFTFDRQTGEVSTVSQLGLGGTIVGILVVALAIALSFALTTPLKAKEVVYWLGLFGSGAFNTAMFFVWQLGKEGFAAEPAIFAFFTGIVAAWCFVATWVVTGEETTSGLTERFVFSLVLLLVGVFLETAITVTLFQGSLLRADYLILALLYALPALLINVVVAAAANTQGELNTQAIKKAEA